ncbi:MAG: hypothetical protein GY865_16300 [candidate division Zixibacteria bacterium]|nr:hypothetical protein [candidate division Zixibacteria bacterium]
MKYLRNLFRICKKYNSQSDNQSIKNLRAELIAVLNIEDYKEKQKVMQNIIQRGSATTPILTKIALEFDPNHLEDDPTEIKFTLARDALGLIGEIGKLEDNDAQAIFMQFIRGRSGGEANMENWGGVWSTAVHTLEKIGYHVVE